MGYRPQRSERNLPVKGCSHFYAMRFMDDRCWCDSCGQTWQWVGAPQGWRSLALSHASHGEEKYPGYY